MAGAGSSPDAAPIVVDEESESSGSKKDDEDMYEAALEVGTELMTTESYED